MIFRKRFRKCLETVPVERKNLGSGGKQECYLIYSDTPGDNGR